MNLFNYIPKWIRNKYFIAGTSFIIWMAFFDRNDISLQWKRVGDLKKLQHSERNLEKQISDAKKELQLLKTSPFTLEKYAREKYLMKKDNEDLFIIKENK